jgi:hypothetical protein
MTFVESLSLVLIAVSAASCCRTAPFPAFALFVVFIANLAYANGVVQSESIRSVSALVGLVGAVEFGRGVERMKRRNPVSIPDSLRKVDASAWIGLVLLASMGVDGFGMIVFRLTDVWIVPETTIGILLSVIALGLFGKENEG